MPKPIVFNAFVMNTPSHLSPGLWRHPHDGAHADNTLQHWTDLA